MAATSGTTIATPTLPKGRAKPSRRSARTVAVIATLVVVSAAAGGLVANDLRLVVAAVYFAFGFVVQRARFCSAALVSAVVLSHDSRGVMAILTAVLTAMLGFGILQTLGWITVYPGGVSVVPAAIGGLLYGVGMVLAGGCVSGSLYKATEGRIPSILAVTGIVAGMTVADTGWGRTTIAALAEFGSRWTPSPNLVATDSAAYSHTMTGVALIGLATLSLVYRRHLLSFRLNGAFRSDRGWPLFAVAALIGMLGWVAFLSGPAVGRHYPLGASHIPGALLGLTVHGEVQPAGLLAWTFLLGSAVSAWMRGEIKRRSAPRDTLAVAFLGGVMVGFGGILARGCFIGQVLSGWPLLATQGLIFGAVLIPSNWVTTLFYLRGWRS